MRRTIERGHETMMPSAGPGRPCRGRNGWYAVSLSVVLALARGAWAQTGEQPAREGAPAPAGPGEAVTSQLPVEQTPATAAAPREATEQVPAAQVPAAQTPAAQVPAEQAAPEQVPAAQVPTEQTPATAPALSEAPELEISGEPGKGLTVSTGERFSLNLRSRVQLRYQLSIPAEDAAGERDVQQLVHVSTLRLYFSGHVLTPDLTYVLQLALAARDYRDGSVSPLFDAYFDWKAHRDLSIRAGQYFVPFDRLRTIREFALQLPERPRPVAELSLDRDVGVTFYSDRFLGDRSPVAWRVGAFGGGGTNLTEGKEPGLLLVGRLELRPLGPIDDDAEGDLERRRAPGLAVGAAFANNWNTNRVRSTTGATFSGGTTDYAHAAGDVVFKWWGAALEAEYLWRRASVDQIVSTDADGAPRLEPTRSAHGWVVQASYVFDPPFEIVGRLSRSYALDGTDPRLVTELESRGQEIAAGLNYYVNGHRFKLQADWLARTRRDFQFDEVDQVVHAQLDATF